MAKVKIFELNSPDVGEKISDFLETANLVDNGLFTTDERVICMYRDKDDLGSTKDSLLAELSKRLSDATKSYMVQEIEMSELDYEIATYKGSDDGKVSYEDRKADMVVAHDAKANLIEEIKKQMIRVHKGEFAIPKPIFS